MNTTSAQRGGPQQHELGVLITESTSPNESWIADLLEAARQRAALVGRMKQVLLTNDDSQLREVAELVCGLKKDVQARTEVQ